MEYVEERFSIRTGVFGEIQSFRLDTVILRSFRLDTIQGLID